MHLLAKDEIENWREHFLADEERDEERVQINVLCDMALSYLERRVAGLKSARDMSQALNEGDGSYKP